MNNFIINTILQQATPALGEKAQGLIARIEAAIEASPNKFDDAAMILIQEGVGPALDELWEAAKATENAIDDLVVEFLATAFRHELAQA